MELIWNEINAVELILRETAQTQLEGAVPPPDGRTVRELPDYTAEVFVSSCRTDAGRLDIEGRITAELVAADDSGELYSFISESAFTHTLSNEALEPGMPADVIPSLTALSIRRAPDGRLLLSAVIDLDCMVTSARPIRAIGGVNGAPDMELKTREVPTRTRTELGNAVIRLSDEIASSGADTVLSSGVQLSVRDTAFENGGVTVSGMAAVTVLAKSADGELLQIIRNLPFRESVQTDGAADEVFALVRLNESSVRALGTEFSLISFEADAEIRVFGLRKTALQLPLDAFSPTINFDCVRKKTLLLSSLGGADSQHTVRENVSVPDGMADIFAALSVSARPIATNVGVAGGELTVEGLLPTRLVYRSDGGRIGAFSEDVPFAIRMAAPNGADTARLRMGCSCSVTGGSGRAAQITYSIGCAAEFWSTEPAELVVGLAERNGQAQTGGDPFVPEAFTGMIIHTVGPDEDAFDIAKRFRLPTARVKELNPDQPFSEGSKVLLVL